MSRRKAALAISLGVRKLRHKYAGKYANVMVTILSEIDQSSLNIIPRAKNFG
jgi:hypothetical protein